MARTDLKDLPPGSVVLDGRWVRTQAKEAAATFVAPVKGLASLFGAAKRHEGQGGNVHVQRVRNSSGGPDRWRKG